jgi:hypothetical protein
VGQETITDQERKAEAFTNAYINLLGTVQNRDYTVDLVELGIPATDLQELEGLFSEKEVWDTIRDLPADRAPGPDGFIGAFYHRA